VADLNKYIGGGGKTVKLHEQRELVRSSSAEDLQEILELVQTELLNLRTQAMMQQVPNPMRIRQVRKLVARIHTELAARSQQAA
jgi:large subunit ribosomal protein L29